MKLNNFTNYPAFANLKKTITSPSLEDNARLIGGLIVAEQIKKGL